MATQFHRTVSSAGSDYKATFSAWVKRATPGVENFLLYAYYNSSNNHRLNFLNSDELHINIITSASNSATITTNRKFRDPNAWYHIVVAWDSTQSTASDRIKIYVNGVQETSFSTANYPSQNADMFFNKNTNGLYLGGQDGSNHFQGAMSHVHYVDGTAYSASTFGSTDSTTGEWQINTSPSVTYGTNGWLVFKDGNTYTDQSSNSNNLTLTGTAPTKTEDCPSNVFCTMNPLSLDSNITLSKGNNQVDYSASSKSAKGSLGFSSGKFYWEVKLSSVNNNYPMIGIGDMNKPEMQKPDQQGYPGGFANAYGIYGNGNVYANDSNTGSQGFTYTTNDIIGVAVDLDSGTKTIKWFKNGSQIATYNITNTAPFSAIDYSGGSSDQLQYNFGNGYFGTTAVSSAGTNASGNGIFEYDVPAGYTALSTKGLNL